MGADVTISMWPDDKPCSFLLRCRGIVVRAVHEGIGVEIRDMDRAAFAYYRDLVAALSMDSEHVEGELRQYVNPGQ